MLTKERLVCYPLHSEWFINHTTSVLHYLNNWGQCKDSMNWVSLRRKTLRDLQRSSLGSLWILLRILWDPHPLLQSLVCTRDWGHWFLISTTILSLSKGNKKWNVKSESKIWFVKSGSLEIRDKNMVFAWGEENSILDKDSTKLRVKRIRIPMYYDSQI